MFSCDKGIRACTMPASPAQELVAVAPMERPGRPGRAVFITAPRWNLPPVLKRRRSEAVPASASRGQGSPASWAQGPTQTSGQTAVPDLFDSLLRSGDIAPGVQVPTLILGHQHCVTLMSTGEFTQYITIVKQRLRV
jgi:hypothetical protein